MKKYGFLIVAVIVVFAICLVVKFNNKNNYELTKIDTSLKYELIDDYQIYNDDNEPKLYLIKSLENDCYGFIDTTGNVVIEPKYKTTLGFHNGISAVNMGEKWFYIDANENTIIDNINGNDITKLGDFYDGLIPLGVDEKDGNYLIDSNGDILLEPTEETYFYSSFDVGNGIVNVFDEQDRVYLKTINKNGEEMPEIKNPLYLLNQDGIGFYKSIDDTNSNNLDNEKMFVSDLYPYYGNNFGIYDLNNKSEITDVMFKSVSRFNEDGLSVVTSVLNDDVCIINTKGEVVINLSEKLKLNNDDILNVTEINDNKIIVTVGKTFDDGTTLLVDTKGNLISDKHKIVGLFKSGLAQIEKDGKYGYIDVNGDIVLEPIYDFAGVVYNNNSVISKESITYKFTYNK